MNYWTEGAEAFDAGIPMEECQYDKDSYPYRRWTDGWIDSWYELKVKRSE